MECEYSLRCLNKDKCYKCYGNKFLKLKEDTKYKSMKKSTKFDYSEANKDDSWTDLEQKVSNTLNRIPTIREARRSRASGALEFEKGDIVDELLHPECKERQGTKLKGGDKSLSIKKSWLDKAKAECKNSDKTMCLPFRFKGDENIYVVIDFDDLADLVTTLKSYITDNKIQSEQIKLLLKEVGRNNV